MRLRYLELGTCNPRVLAVTGEPQAFLKLVHVRSRTVVMLE
jgi:hypothetical protein